MMYLGTAGIPTLKDANGAAAADGIEFHEGLMRGLFTTKGF